MIELILAATAVATTPTAARFECGRRAVVARFSHERAVLDWQGRAVRLSLTPVERGARYDGLDRRRRVTFWVDGNAASLTVGSRTYPTCRRADPPLGRAA